MGSIGECCCGCCSGSCSQEIAQIKLTINGGAYGPQIYTRDIDHPMTQDCYEYLLAGNWCEYITDTKTAVIGCGDRLGFLRDLKVTITHTGSPQPAFVFPCPILGSGFWSLGRAKVETTSVGSSHEYYWPTEIFHNSVIDGTYNGTGFTFTSGNNWFGNTFCGTDADLAADIKADLVSALSGTHPEFLSSAFSVTVERNSLSCSGSSIGVGSQTATWVNATCATGFGGATPSCYKFNVTSTSIVRGAVIELAPAELRVILLLAKSKTINWGADCQPGGSFLPRPADETILGVASRSLQVSLDPSLCFDEYDFSINIPAFSGITGGFTTGFACSPPVGGVDTPAAAINVTGKVELIYA